MTVNEIRRQFIDFFVAEGAHARRLVVARARQRPDAAVHELRHGAVQGRVPRAGQAAVRARDVVAALRARRRQAQRPRERRLHGAASHVLRDARQLQLRRLLQARRDPLRVGAPDRRLRAAERTGSGSPSTSTTTRRTTSGARRSAFPRSGSSASATTRARSTRPTTSGRWPTPVRADRARRSSTTTARRWRAVRRDRRTRKATATSRSGTSCSCSSTATRRAISRRCRRPASTPAWVSSASPRCCSTCIRTTRSTCSRI